MSILAVDRPAGSGRSRHRGLLTPLMIVRPAVGGSPVIRAVVLLRWSPHRRAPPLVRVRENGPPWEDGGEGFRGRLCSECDPAHRVAVIACYPAGPGWPSRRRARTSPVWCGPARTLRGLRRTPLGCLLLYTSPSPRDGLLSRMPS